MKQKGFTLIELMTAISVFAVVMVISMGSILGVFEANRKSRSMKNVMNNLNLALESMSKEIRFGTRYHCGSGDITVPQNCSSGSNHFGFLSSDGEQIVYDYTTINGNGVIAKQVGNGTFVPVTAPEIIIDSLTFYVIGSGTGDNLHPKVMLRIKAHAGAGEGRSDLTLQTIVSQRLPEQ